MPESTDILIVGGGLVGASLAIALDAAGRGATLIEAAAPPALAPDGAPRNDDNDRNLALARASVNALRALGVWRHAEAAAAPITRLHVSRAGEFGSTRLSATETGVDALGATVPGRALGAALERRLQACTRVQRLAPAKLETLRPAGSGWRATVRAGDGTTREFEARLLVGADGSDSFVRHAVGIGAGEHDYGQSLFVCTVACERDAEGCAYERFSDQGPVALLPLPKRRMGLVLTVPAARHEEVAALDDNGFLALAQARFGWKSGRLALPGRRHVHRARRVLAQSLTAPRAVVIGNAAQTVHPIGAQGFNLGLRDALTLAEMVAAAGDPGAPAVLRAYAVRRAPDRAGVLAFSHGLVSLACLPQPLLAPLRSLALAAFDRVPPLKHALARRGMGFRSAPPAMALDPVP